MQVACLILSVLSLCVSTWLLIDRLIDKRVNAVLAAMTPIKDPLTQPTPVRVEHNEPPVTYIETPTTAADMRFNQQIEELDELFDEPNDEPNLTKPSKGLNETDFNL
jgi:hypothetical protein